MASSDFSQINALDPNTLGGLRRLSKQNSPEASKEAAKQFEALFVQQMLKSMRDATPKGGMLDNDETRMYQSLLDQQMAMQLSTRAGGIGLAKVIERQMNVGQSPSALPDGPVSLDTAIRRGFDSAAAPTVDAAASRTARPTAKSAAAAAGTAASGLGPTLPNMPAGAGPRAFVEKVWPQAVEASKATGIPARFLVAQAALETGWGKYELKNADGSASPNLFNIKAGKSWNGATVNTSICAAPALRNTLAHSSMVLPVVSTSSTSRMRLPCTSPPSLTAKTRWRLLRRSRPESWDCGVVTRLR